MTEKYEAIGKRIKAGRKRIGITQEDLAKHLGLSRTSICNIEVGRQALTIDHLHELTKLFSCSADEILGFVKPIVSEIRDENSRLKNQINRIIEICEETR